jgi:beta-glucosidase
MTTFPDGFLWGAATAGHQVEGSNVNADIWPLEWEQGSIFTEPSGDACDHYHRYPYDIATLAGLGLNAYRFSLEWSRIEPEPGYFSRAALDHYRRMIGTCLEHGVTPVVTYCHFTTPRWFAGAGGWESDDAPGLFARYATRATEHLGDLLSWVATLNEPNIMALMTSTGDIPMGVGERGPVADAPAAPVDAQAGVGGFDPARYRMGLIGGDVERMASAHRLAVEAIKSGAEDANVGWTLAIVDLQPAEGGEERCDQARRLATLDWLDVARDDDFVGVQTYSRYLIGPAGRVPVPEGAPIAQTGWEVYPEALGHTVRLAAERAGVPILVTENGLATDDDDARIAYTKAALEGLAGCVDDGIDVRGYLHWTLLDNFEWTSGYAKTFGLIAVNRETFARTVKPSARWLGEVARANRLG